MERVYDHILVTHIDQERAMAFVAGPRQVGKTTTSRHALPNALYLNWDSPDHRRIVLAGPRRLFEEAGVYRLGDTPYRTVIFDEIHKFGRWKSYLKGVFDTCEGRLRICVTGSARLSVYQRGGDSLMGRYFPYRMHPITIREALDPAAPDTAVRSPVAVPNDLVEQLLRYGGFPEPFTRADTRFHNRWRRLRSELLFSEDVRDIARVTDIGRMHSLADMLVERAGGLLNMSNLAGDLQLSVDTVRRWLDILESLYFCFRVRPYSARIARSLRREPKVYLWDWSQCPDEGARLENMVAQHLLKAVHLWTDLGIGACELWYLRDKEMREVDFCVTRDSNPWMLVEVKRSETRLSDSLRYFQRVTRAPHAFQAVADLPFLDADCFAAPPPVVVPLVTLLSQLV